MHFSLEDFLYKWLPHFFCLPREGGSIGQAGWWLKVISISTIARKLCAGACTLFKNSTSIKMHNFKFWQQIYVSANIQRFQIQCWLLESHENHFAKGKEAIFCDIDFFWKMTEWISKSVLRPRFNWLQIKKMMKLLWVFPSMCGICVCICSIL